MRLGRTMAMYGACAAALVGLLFALGWLIRTKKNGGLLAEAIPDALGFGLLPGAAVWAVFEHWTPLGKGLPVMEPIPVGTWWTPDGMFAPARVEMTLLLVCFAGMCLWLALRRREELPRGEVLCVGLALWATVRMITEGLRQEQYTVLGGHRMVLYAAMCILLLLAVRWAMKDRRPRNQAAVWLMWIAFLAAIAVPVLQGQGLMTVGSDIGDLLVKAGCAAVCLLLALSLRPRAAD